VLEWTPEFDPPLSEEGRQRRDQILRVALADAARRRERANRWRMVPVGAAIVLAIYAMRLSTEPPVYSPAAKVAKANGGRPVVETNTGIRIFYVHTDPHLLERWAAPPSPATWQYLSDDDLLDNLASHGMRAGLAYVDGRRLLVPLIGKSDGAAGQEIAHPVVR
jgi:hypothetical protein